MNDAVILEQEVRDRREVRSSDGVTLSYRVIGAGSPVLCIQGVGVIGDGWEPQLAPLSHRFRVLTFDNRGIGRSARSPSGLSIDAMASDVWTIADAAAVERCHLVGHSMGGLIALRAALVSPARVKSLSLLCTFADGAAATRLSLRMAVLGIGTRVGTRGMRRRAMQRMLFPAAFLKDVDRAALAVRLQELFGRDLADTPPIVTEQLRSMSACNVTEALSKLAGIPALVVSGRHDPIAPPALGRAIAEGIPGARYVEFDEASHALPVQCADRVNALILEHLDAAD